MEDCVEDINFYKGGLIGFSMRETEVLYHKFDRAVNDDCSLSLPIKHLLGNGIGLYVENGSQIHVSEWQLRDGAAEGYGGRIYISPVKGIIPKKEAGLILIEDIVVGDRPADYPSIVGRVTCPELAIRSLYYPKSMKLWEFYFHMRPIDEVVGDSRYDMVREEVLSCFGHRGRFKRINIPA